MLLIVFLAGLAVFWSGYVIGHFKGFNQAIDEYEEGIKENKK